jgi:DNA-binding GntR family transcriptional regulator
MLTLEVIPLSIPEPLGTVSAVEAVAARLRDKILDGLIQPGQDITEVDVSKSYGVSRPTAKSAITLLITDRLLRQEANKPAYVPRLSGDDLRDLFLVRVPLELEVVRRVSGRDTIPASAEAAVSDMRRLRAESPTSQFVEADLGFHRSLVEAVGSPRLTRLYRAIQGEMHLSMVQSKRILGPQRVSREHRAILQALRQGARERAEERMRSHLENARDEIAGWLDESE